MKTVQVLVQSRPTLVTILLRYCTTNAFYMNTLSRHQYRPGDFSERSVQVFVPSRRCTYRPLQAFVRFNRSW